MALQEFKKGDLVEITGFGIDAFAGTPDEDKFIGKIFEFMENMVAVPDGFCGQLKFHGSNQEYREFVELLNNRNNDYPGKLIAFAGVNFKPAFMDNDSVDRENLNSLQKR